MTTSPTTYGYTYRLISAQVEITLYSDHLILPYQGHTVVAIYPAYFVPPTAVAGLA